MLNNKRTLGLNASAPSTLPADEEKSQIGRIISQMRYAGH